jgi:4-aminobutyrate aminotransferase
MEKHLFRGVGRLSSLVIERGKGSFVYATTQQGGQQEGGASSTTTTTSTMLLDMTSGIGVVNTGHCHPRVVEAAQRQCEKIVHAQVNLSYHPPMLDLTRDLLENALQKFPSLDRIFYSTTGAEAVENAIKLARSVTRRSSVVVFQGGYHGRTQLTMGLTTSSTVYRKSGMSHAHNVFVAPYPYELHDPIRYSSESCLRDLQLLLKQQVDPRDVAAVLIEPVLGEGGYVPAPAKFLQGLRTLCDEHGILLISDEVQTGFGRTGQWFATSSSSIEPDILVMAKGLASGFPLSAVAATSQLADAQEPGTMGGTYAGNAVACAAALATQHVIRDEGLLENAQAVGSYLKAALEAVQSRYPHAVRDVRGVGCMVGVEFYEPTSSEDRTGGGPDVPPALNKLVSQQCLQNGMLLLPASVFPTVRFIPPLTVSKSEIDMAVEVFERSVAEVLMKK